MAAQNIVKQLRAFTTCDISDALCALKYPNGGFLSGLTMWSPERLSGPTKIFGPAYTVKYVRISEEAPKQDTHYIDQVPSDSIVFVSSPPNVPNAVYGGLMSTRAKYLGAAGAVIDGRFRDLEEHRALNFPLFARDIGTAPPYESVKVAAVNVPVKLQSEHQDMEIRPGDYLMGDVNGVVVLPKEKAGEVIALMAKRVEADEKVREGLTKGLSFKEASAVFR
ncbi:RraA-like protein [Phaeosphaeria sp. MPI-PUGE-AT-0046c]|nr:RraA-like protein [Phaeosphaeria sp. MPI-PUGE-AT-0046c]